MGKFKEIWDRGRDGDRKEQRSFLRVVIVATAVFIVFMFIKKDNVIRWIDAGITISRQEKQIKRNNAVISDMDSHLGSIRRDRDTIEAYARETYGYSEVGDDVYLIKK